MRDSNDQMTHLRSHAYWMVARPRGGQTANSRFRPTPSVKTTMLNRPSLRPASTPGKQGRDLVIYGLTRGLDVVAPREGMIANCSLGCPAVPGGRRLSVGNARGSWPREWRFG